MHAVFDTYVERGGEGVGQRSTSFSHEPGDAFQIFCCVVVASLASGVANGNLVGALVPLLPDKCRDSYRVFCPFWVTVIVIRARVRGGGWHRTPVPESLNFKRSFLVARA